jgi:hypothetical protein
MNRLRTLKHIFALVVLVLACASAARAQVSRTWVSGTGDDSFPCSRTAPCRTFGGAFVKTAINGEINVLNGGSYGTLNVTKSITVDGNGANSTILSSGATAFVVNIAAGNANDPHRSARLRNLSLNGTGLSGSVGTRTGIDGVRFFSGLSLFVENVVINDFSQDGVEVNGSFADANAMYVSLNNVQIRNCNRGLGMLHNHFSGQVVAKLNNVRIHGCGQGVVGQGHTRVNINDSVVTHCTTGLQQSGEDNVMNVDDVFVSYATTALESDANSTMRVSDSVITQNSTGLNVNGGTITSLSGNTLTGNTANGAFTGAAVPKS